MSLWFLLKIDIGDGDCGNTAITAVIPTVMGTFVAVIPREWG